MNIIEQNGFKSFFLQDSETVFFGIPPLSGWTTLKVGLALSVFTGQTYDRVNYDYNTGEIVTNFDINGFSAGIKNVVTMGITNSTGGATVFNKPFLGITSNRVLLSGLGDINSTGFQFSSFNKGSRETGYAELLCLSSESKYCVNTEYIAPINQAAGYTYLGVYPRPTFAIAPLLQESLSGNYYWNVISYERNPSGFFCSFNNPQFLNFKQINYNQDQTTILESAQDSFRTSALSFSTGLFSGDAYFALSWPHRLAKLRIHDFACIYN